MSENQEIAVGARRSRQEVRRLVLEFEASGLRQSEFCRRHGLALSTLKRHLKKRSLSPGEPRAVVQLAAVEVAGQDRKRELRAGAALEVVLGCGRRIEVRPAFDAATLGRLVEVLEAL
jgi:transposase-like protein